MRDHEKPSPGNLTVCGYCASLLEYTDTLELRAYTQADFEKLDEATRVHVERVRLHILMANQAKRGPASSDAYVQQVQKMSENAAKWRLDNPGREVKVQFNNPQKVFVSAVISEAIRTHLVSVNDAGLELIKAMWPWKDDREPTVFMVRLALEHEARHK